jgi:uncharacterized protein
MAWSHGTFYWNELMTRDVEHAKKFYGDTLGWTFDSMPSPGGTYWLGKIGNQTVGGLFDISGPDFKNVPESWMSYIAVDNVDERVKKATKAGAKVMKPAFDVPGVGRIAILVEPGGAAVGWMTPVN